MEPIKTHAFSNDEQGNICVLFGNMYVKFEQGHGKLADGSQFQYLRLSELTEPITIETEAWPPEVPGLPDIRLMFKNKESIDVFIEQLRELRGHAKGFELLDKKMEDQDLPIRALNVLREAEIVTVRDLVRYKRTDLLKFRNFGKVSLRMIDEWLEKHNLQFGLDV